MLGITFVCVSILQPPRNKPYQDCPGQSWDLEGGLNLSTGRTGTFKPSCSPAQPLKAFRVSSWKRWGEAVLFSRRPLGPCLSLYKGLWLLVEGWNPCGILASRVSQNRCQGPQLSQPSPHDEPRGFRGSRPEGTHWCWEGCVSQTAQGRNSLPSVAFLTAPRVLVPVAVCL